MKFVFACGGTAGHINPALAVADLLKTMLPGSEFLFFGAEGQMEMDLIPRAGYDVVPLTVTNISRGHSLDDVKHNMVSIRNVTHAVFQAKGIIKEFKPDAVIGTGGYVCFPVISAAHELGIKTYIHESNAVPGLTTKMLSGIVDCVFVGMVSCEQNYPNNTKVLFTGTPVRSEFNLFTKTQVRKELGISDECPLVLSVWGSLGSEFMNDAVRRMIPYIPNDSFKLIHATGKKYYASFSDMIGKYVCADIYEYIYDIPKLMTAADLVICRGGAATMSELNYSGKPAIIVPSPNVTNNHQEKNARVLEQSGGARVILEKDMTCEVLLNEILSLVKDKDKLNTMSQAMFKAGCRDSASRIADYILSDIK